MKLNEYQEKAMRTNIEGDLLQASMGLVGESGEVMDLLKKHRYQGHPLDVEKLIEEAGDVLWYVSALAESIGVRLEDIAQYNIEKLEKRYPKGFEKERSVNRD